VGKPNTDLWESSYAYDWIQWCGWRIRQEEFTDVRHALYVIMRETKGTVNPKWISGWFCPACEGTKLVEGESCINCEGKGVFEHYMNEVQVKPKKNKAERALEWYDVMKAAEAGNKRFEEWLKEKESGES